MVMQKLEKLDVKEDTPQNEQGQPQLSEMDEEGVHIINPEKAKLVQRKGK